MTHTQGKRAALSTEVNSIPCFSTFPELRSLESSGPDVPEGLSYESFGSH